MYRWWCVLVTLPVLLVSTQGPSDGYCYNTTLVAGEPFNPLPTTNTPPQATVQFTSSVVGNGMYIYTTIDNID